MSLSARDHDARNLTKQTVRGSSKASAPGTPKAEEHRGFSARLESFLNSFECQGFVGSVIIANAIIIGFETDYPEGKLWPFLEALFLVIFVVELLLRLCAFRLDFFRPTGSDFMWNMFDFVLVGVGVFDVFISEIRVAQGHTRESGRFTLLRVFRLLRILRIFRLFRMLKQLYILISGFIEATFAIFWISVLCTLMIYVCAIMLTRVLGHKAENALKMGGASSAFDERGNLFIMAHFGDIKKSMFTLFQIMAEPNISEFAIIVDNDPYMKLFFMLFIIFCSFSMISLLTGVISETMIEKSQLRKHELVIAEADNRQRFVTRMRELFTDIDVDGDRSLSKAEFANACQKISQVLEQDGSAIAADELEQVYEMIDFDKSGQIDMDEFLTGMGHVKKDMKTLHAMEVQYAIRKAKADIEKNVDNAYSKLREQMSELEGRLDTFTELLQMGGPVSE